MKIAIDCDDAAVNLKKVIYDHIKSKGIDITDLDFTATKPEGAMYPEIGYNLALKIKDKTYDRGILICGTGLGMAMIANKVETVYAGVCHDCFSAERLRKSNNAQVITMGERVVGPELAKTIIDSWLLSEFEGGGSTAKVEQMRLLEQKSFNNLKNNMKKLILIFICTLVLANSTIVAQNPLWQGKGRIAISSDGNEHDHDDWAATPLTLALLASQGLEDKVALYTYSDHIWGSNLDHPTSESGLNSYQHMRESALEGQKWFGFENTKFICAVDNPEVAYNAMRDEINKSTAKNPLLIIAAGPMQVAGEGINRSDIKKRRFVTVLSHSDWNNLHSDKPGKNEPPHNGWTFKEMQDSFGTKEGGNTKFIKIADQNGGEGYDGLNAPIEKFDWIKTSEARNNPIYKPGAWDWLYSRQKTCLKENNANFDPSDAGMIVYILTGIDRTEPFMGQKLMENPVAKKK